MILRVAKHDNCKHWEKGTILSSHSDNYVFGSEEKKSFVFVKVPDKTKVERLTKKINLKNLDNKHPAEIIVIDKPDISATNVKQHPKTKFERRKKIKCQLTR